MRTTTPVRPHRRTPPAESRRPAPPADAPEGPASPDAAERRLERAARAAGGPDDWARYDCLCGWGFHARVTTSVACPRCGTVQAW
jgi:hypothetical protein